MFYLRFQATTDVRVCRVRIRLMVVFFPSLFNVKAFPKSTRHTVGHTRVECIIYWPTLRDSNVTTGNCALHRVKTVVP